MRRFPISTQVVTAVFLAGVALAGGVSADWCIWWRAAYIIVVLLAVGLLGMRGVNRARIKERQMLDRLNEQDDFVHASIEESQAKSAAQMNQFRRDMLRGFGESIEVQERILEELDPCYLRPLRDSGAVVGAAPEISANADLGPLPPRRERLRLRLMYILRWIWGTHDAPPAKG